MRIANDITSPNCQILGQTIFLPKYRIFRLPYVLDLIVEKLYVPNALVEPSMESNRTPK